jgi:3-methyl-2-oxobutanoate hydroxymethyltransferase
MYRGHTPKFAKRFAEIGDAIVDATKQYVDEVRARSFPGAEHSFKPNTSVAVVDAPKRAASA